MKKITLVLLLAFLPLRAQQAGNFVSGAKIIDVGFKNAEMVNVSTVKKSRYALFRWEKAADYYEIAYGFPLCRLVEKEHGLDHLKQQHCLNFITPKRITENEYLLKTAYFDVVFKVYAYKQNTLVGISQIRYVRQKH